MVGAVNDYREPGIRDQTIISIKRSPNPKALRTFVRKSQYT